MWRPTVSSDELYHSRGPWKKHKYVAIKNGKYVYSPTEYKNAVKSQISKTKNAIRDIRSEQEKKTKKYSERLEAKRLRELDSGNYEAARRTEKQKKVAESVYKQGQMKDYDKEKQRQTYALAKALGGVKPKNPTARKNQRRAKLESLIYKGKSKVKKLLKKMTPHSETKYTINGVNFTVDKKRKTTPVRKASKKTGEQIYNAYKAQQKKKKKR